jgi:hypothetical protein
METYQSQEITELAKAMLKVQAELQPAFKDRQNTFTKSSYATLNSVMDTCRESLIKHGIWLVQHPVPVDQGNLGLVTKLVHTQSGQWQSSLMIMPLPKSDPQGYGSALTYGRRYSLSTLIGIVTEDDDDGEAASAGKGKRPSRPHKDSGQEPQTSPKSSFQDNPTAHPILASMPKLDGISYSTISTQDDKICIVATGDTRSKKQLLLQAGFRWSDQRKIWWKYADAA